MAQIRCKCTEGCWDCKFIEECKIKDFLCYLRELVNNKFHGNIIIPFKDGHIGKIKKEEIIDIDNLYDKDN
ncbi:MAG TPA: hypothetical protein PLD27_02690 [bacterium]|nr:hypothetical protein [bacterium]HOL46746.1 hypothetical protein [bacterium]HPQ18182.1 hypothetical protein [bacterium]